MSKSTFNKYQYINRTVKAAKLAGVLLDVEADPSTLTDEQWIMAGQAAKLIPMEQSAIAAIKLSGPWPSEDTRARTIELLEEVRLKARALLEDIRATVPAKK